MPHNNQIKVTKRNGSNDHNHLQNEQIHLFVENISNTQNPSSRTTQRIEIGSSNTGENQSLVLIGKVGDIVDALVKNKDSQLQTTDGGTIQIKVAQVSNNLNLFDDTSTYLKKPLEIASSIAKIGIPLLNLEDEFTHNPNALQSKINDALRPANALLENDPSQASGLSKVFYHLGDMINIASTDPLKDLNNDKIDYTLAHDLPNYTIENKDLNTIEFKEDLLKHIAAYLEKNHKSNDTKVQEKVAEFSSFFLEVLDAYEKQAHIHPENQWFDKRVYKFLDKRENEIIKALERNPNLKWIADQYIGSPNQEYMVVLSSSTSNTKASEKLHTHQFETTTCDLLTLKDEILESLSLQRYSKTNLDIRPDLLFKHIKPLQEALQKREQLIKQGKSPSTLEKGVERSTLAQTTALDFSLSRDDHSSIDQTFGIMKGLELVQNIVSDAFPSVEKKNDTQLKEALRKSNEVFGHLLNFIDHSYSLYTSATLSTPRFDYEANFVGKIANELTKVITNNQHLLGDDIVSVDETTGRLKDVELFAKSAIDLLYFGKQAITGNWISLSAGLIYKGITETDKAIQSSDHWDKATNYKLAYERAAFHQLAIPEHQKQKEQQQILADTKDYILKNHKSDDPQIQKRVDLVAYAFLKSIEGYKKSYPSFINDTLKEIGIDKNQLVKEIPQLRTAYNQIKEEVSTLPELEGQKGLPVDIIKANIYQEIASNPNPSTIKDTLYKRSAIIDGYGHRNKTLPQLSTEEIVQIIGNMEDLTSIAKTQEQSEFLENLPYGALDHTPKKTQTIKMDSSKFSIPQAAVKVSAKSNPNRRKIFNLDAKKTQPTLQKEQDSAKRTSTKTKKPKGRRNSI